MTRTAENRALAQTRRRHFLDRVRHEIAPGLTAGPLGLAVSGGSDSLGMLHALALLAPEFGWSLSVATVDHRLRDGAAEEARMVAKVCADIGVPHRTLVWAHRGVVDGNLMDAARRARYALLADWAQGIGRVAVAHTADDQAETVLMGLARAAGLDGLCGLRPDWQQGGVRFLRPFLGVTRAEVQGFLRDGGVIWADDPTNDDPAYDRIKARKALAGLHAAGITPDKLARVARNLAAVQADLRGMLAEVTPRVVTEAAGALRFDRAALAGLPDELARRLVQAGLMWLSGQDYPPRAASLARFLQALRDGRRATLWGCLLRPTKDALWLLREPRSAGPEVPLGAVWDGRWRVTGPGAGVVRALGADGLRQVPDWRVSGLPREVALVTPGVFDGATLLAAPVFGSAKGFTATFTAGFGLFPLSH